MCRTGGVWKYIYPRAKILFRGNCTAEDFISESKSRVEGSEAIVPEAVKDRERARVYADCLAEFKKSLSFWYLCMQCMLL